MSECPPPNPVSMRSLMSLIRDPLDLIEGNLSPSPVIEPSRAGAFMAGQLLSNLKPADVLQQFRDARRPETVGSPSGPI